MVAREAVDGAIVAGFGGLADDDEGRPAIDVGVEKASERLAFDGKGAADDPRAAS